MITEEAGGLSPAESRPVCGPTAPRTVAVATSPARPVRGSSLSFLAHVERVCVPVPFSGCLVYEGALDEHGYPCTTHKGVQLHRAALEYKLGRKLSRRTFACHTCDVRACCNPDHLFAGTNRQNVRDKCRKRRQARVPNGGVRLTLERARWLRDSRATHPIPTRKLLAEQHGISVRQVDRILAHQRWKELVMEAAE